MIVRKLYRKRIIGDKHTAIEHTTQGFPKHLIGQAKEVVNELIKKNIILADIIRTSDKLEPRKAERD